MRISSGVCVAAAEEVSYGCCGWALIALSWLMVILTVPFSLFLCIKVVQEYERAVIFRLGRLVAGGAKGPGKDSEFTYAWRVLENTVLLSAKCNCTGMFFIVPCIDSYRRVDLRVVSFDVPPQEASSHLPNSTIHSRSDPVQRQCNRGRRCGCVLPHQQRDDQCYKCGGCGAEYKTTRTDHTA
jgi:hypothetical protein